MKATILIYLLGALVLFGTSSCATRYRVQTKAHNQKTIPPGQAKKMTGSKSAKPFAPGHNK